MTERKMSSNILFKIYIKVISRVATIAYTGSLRRNKELEESFHRAAVNIFNKTCQERALKQVEITQCIIGYAKADDNGDTIVSVDDIN